MPDHDRDSTIAALIEQGATAAAVADALGVTEQHARRLIKAAGLEPAPAPRGRPWPERPAADRRVTLTVTAEQYQALVDYADRSGGEIEDAIKDNVLGQCPECSEAAILDARRRRLCERCRRAEEERPPARPEPYEG